MNSLQHKYSWSSPQQYKLYFFTRVLGPDQFLKIQAIPCRKIYQSFALGWVLMNIKFSSSLDKKKKSWKEIKICRILILFSYLLFPYFYLNSPPLCNNRSLGCDFTVGALTACWSSKQRRNIFQVQYLDSHAESRQSELSTPVLLRLQSEQMYLFARKETHIYIQ